ncbi:hypothetical protein ACQE98_10350 [Ornithinimicrobium sp. W1679]|uniref:hypothetical protein n=1 Tax=Ornithinimicrobium sp. W1679 TaxID=3418770 RepID=UPI003CF4F6BD
MFTLHIEHAVSDFVVWERAYAGFAGHRSRAGVVADRVARPVEDDAYVLLDLDFPTLDQARGFERFLHDQVWSTPALSPALAGSPRTVVVRRELADPGTTGSG